MPTNLVSPLTLRAAADQISEHGLDPFVERLVARIEEIDPQIFALLPEDDRRRRLLADATFLRDRFPDPGLRPPLFGIPVAIKDIIHVQGFETGAGTQVPVEVMQGREGYLVGRLKELGALMVGKAVTTEFAMLAPNGTRNPHAPDHTPGGSSSGSTAAIAAGLAVFALGTQTVGSIIRPASFCGVTGFKPSFGRMPSDGLLYVSPSLDHLGFFAADVESLISLAQFTLPDWRQGVSDADRPLTLGIPEGPYLDAAGDEILAALQSLVRHLEGSAGDRSVTIKAIKMFPDFDELTVHHNKLARAEFAMQHADLYPHFGAQYRSLTASLLEEGARVAPQEVAHAQERQHEVRAAVEATMVEHGIDAWLSPAALGSAPKGLEATGSPVMNGIWTFAGLPVAVFPLPREPDQLPLGLQLTGKFGGDEEMLEITEHIAKLAADTGPLA